MEKQIHVVLGGAGTIGQAVIKELRVKNLPVRAVERSKEVSGIETVKADLLDPAQTLSAIQGASHVYLCIGIPYFAKIWAAEWPVVMKNVISACEKTNSKLIFFDNVYMYGPAPLSVPFDETHRQEPPSRKGKIRKQIADMLLEAHMQGKIEAVIGRSADFYGPGAVNSMLYSSLLERIIKGKAPQLLVKPGAIHTFAYTEDNGRALVALALDDNAYGEVWHLPSGKPITTEEAVEFFNKELGTNLKPQFISPLLRRFLGIFIPILREAGEMNYQFETDYVMSFEKFKKRFPDFQAMPMEEGLRVMAKSFHSTYKSSMENLSQQNSVQQLDSAKIKTLEHQLDDVMEIIDTDILKHKLAEVEEAFKINPTEINKARLGIIYHETSLNLSFFSKTEYKGYAKKSFDILTEMFNSPSTTKELLPFIASFRASALSLVGAETRKIKLIGEAFVLFADAVEKYASVTYLPEYLRGSVAENLPWYFFSKRKLAKADFQSIIDKQDKNADYANWKIMSFTYWAWAKQHQSSKYRKQAIMYLDKAIALDANYQAGRKKSEELKAKIKMNKALLTKTLSTVGVIGPLFFIILLTVLGFLWQGYSPITQFMSEIGTVGSPYSPVMQFGGFSLLGLVWVLFCIMLLVEFKKTWISYIGIGLLLLGAFAMFAVGFFRCDASCINITFSGKTHSMLAMISNISFVFGMLVLHFQIRKDDRFSKSLVNVLLIMAIVSNILSPLIMLPQLKTVTGLVQRAGIFLPLIWTSIISYIIYMNINNTKRFRK